MQGYRDTNGWLFVDQAEKSAKRARKKRKTAAPDEDSPPTVTMTKAVPPDPGMVSVAYFFNSYMTTGRNPLTSRGHFDFLLPFYSKARPFSLLALAMEVVAGRSMASRYRRSMDSIWHAESLVRASEAMRSAISDPIECLTDETLLAVLLLDFAEHIKSRRMRTLPSHVHQNAATGLVRLRGAQNFESKVKMLLLHATRSNSLHRAVNGCVDQNLESTLLAYTTVDFEDCNPAVRLDGLIACGVRLGHKLTRTLNEDCGHALTRMKERLQRLSGRLLCWRNSLTEDWFPKPQNMAQPPTEFGVLGPNRKETYPFETFGTLDVALVYNQWRCTRLMVSKLLRACEGSSASHRSLDLGLEATDLVKDIWRSVPYFMHGPKLCLVAEPSSRTSLEAMQQLQLEQPSGLGTWYLGQVLDWIIAILEDDAGWIDADRANVTAFCELREALHSQMVMETVPARSSSV